MTGRQISIADVKCTLVYCIPCDTCELRDSYLEFDIGGKIIVFCSLRNRIEYKMMMRAFAADVKGILKTEVLEIGHLDKGMFFRQ